MLDINYIEINQEMVIEKLKKRGVENAKALILGLIALNQKRKKTQFDLDTLSAELNQLQKRMPKLLQMNEGAKIVDIKLSTKLMKAKIKTLAEELNGYMDSLKQELCKIPNLPHDTVPDGKTAADNMVVFEHTVNPLNHISEKFPHWELIKKFDIIDFELGTKLTGAGFPVYKNKGAKLQRALINFFLEEAEKEGYQEIQPPLLVNEQSAFGTGQLPDKEGQMYHIANESPFFLIPTAEVPVTNLYRDQTIPIDLLPIKHVAYTPCFRREAGSWGSHVRGLNRLHQFDKVELVTINLPENSYEALAKMRSYVEGLLQKLGLPYRVLSLCTGDLSFTSAFTYDLEVFSVGQHRWLEVSSISNFETYQANRLQLKYKAAHGKSTLLHTLNGSALALPRIVAALLEFYQGQDKIAIPPVLRPYTGFDYID